MHIEKYSKRYVADELKAKKEFIGIWKSAFTMPDQWRKYQKFKKNQVMQSKIKVK